MVFGFPCTVVDKEELLYCMILEPPTFLLLWERSISYWTLYELHLADPRMIPSQAFGSKFCCLFSSPRYILSLFLRQTAYVSSYSSELTYQQTLSFLLVKEITFCFLVNRQIFLNECQAMCSVEMQCNKNYEVEFLVLQCNSWWLKTC